MSTESIKDLREEFDDGAMEPHLIRLLDRLEAAEARVAELEAAQQPRDMADALRDGEHILPVCTSTHWLPLPDREDSPESPGIGASGKTEGV